MNGVPKLRLIRGDDEVATSQKRATARECGALNTRDDRGVDRTELCDTGGESDEKFLDSPRFFRTTRKIKARAKVLAVATEDNDIRSLCINLPTRFDNALLQFGDRLRVERVAFCRVCERDRRNSGVDREGRERGQGVHIEVRVSIGMIGEQGRKTVQEPMCWAARERDGAARLAEGRSS